MTERIIDRVARFRESTFPAYRPQFERLQAGQHPLAYFMTCSDSRIDPSLLTQTEPGELFVSRNAGNLIPPWWSDASGEAGTLEFALQVLKVPEVVVCGHSHCGAMQGLLERGNVRSFSCLDAWLRFAEPSLDRALQLERWEELEPNERLDWLACANVLQQLDHLRSYPFVASAEARGELQLHGWLYEFESGAVRVYDPATKTFERLAEPTVR